MKKFRHGDVILKEVAKIPKEATKVKGLILAEGEASGHYHQIKDTSAAVQLQKAEKKYLRVNKVATLTHEEHKPIEIPVGNYEIIIQKEYEPQGYRNVTD